MRELPEGVSATRANLQGKVRYTARISINGMFTHLGTYGSIDAASKAYQEAKSQKDFSTPKIRTRNELHAMAEEIRVYEKRYLLFGGRVVKLKIEALKHEFWRGYESGTKI